MAGRVRHGGRLSLTGWDGLLLLLAAASAGLYPGYRPLDRRRSAAVAGLVAGGFGDAGRCGSQFHVRPLVLSIGLLALTFAWLVNIEAGRKPAAGLWWLGPIFIL